MHLISVKIFVRFLRAKIGKFFWILHVMNLLRRKSFRNIVVQSNLLGFLLGVIWMASEFLSWRIHWWPPKTFALMKAPKIKLEIFCHFLILQFFAHLLPGCSTFGFGWFFDWCRYFPHLQISPFYRPKESKLSIKKSFFAILKLPESRRSHENRLPSPNFGSFCAIAIRINQIARYRRKCFHCHIHPTDIRLNNSKKNS